MTFAVVHVEEAAAAADTEAIAMEIVPTSAALGMTRVLPLMVTVILT